MIRRAMYMYGDLLPKSKTGKIGCGLGQASSTGSIAIIAPTHEIAEDTDPKAPIDIDGLKVQFQLTSGTEAPVEFNVFFPEKKALCMAENISHTLHNIQTLRGALVRDARLWSRYIDDAINLFADDTDFVFASHHWPISDSGDIRKFMVQQRDMYAYLHDQTLRLLNEGYTGTEIAENFTLPDSLAQCWHTQGYYGSLSHNAKAVYNRYMGWFDGNPARLWELPPVEVGKRYVECMGGISGIIARAKSYEDNDLRFAATLLSHAVFGDPSGSPSNEAKEALARVLTKLGYGAENAPWRNFYLTGAYELKNGTTPPLNAQDAFQSLLALNLEQLMDTMAIRMNGAKAGVTEPFTID